MPVLVYRHLTTAADLEAGRTQLLLGGGETDEGFSDQAHDRIAEWARKWVGGDYGGGNKNSSILGAEKKRELKQQILARVVDQKRHSEIMKRVEEQSSVIGSRNTEGVGFRGSTLF